MLGDPPLPAPAATVTAPANPPAGGTAPAPPVDRDILPEVWENLWKKIPHTVKDKPDLVHAADALEHCILYGIDIGCIWSRLRTDMEKFELE